MKKTLLLALSLCFVLLGISQERKSAVSLEKVNKSVELKYDNFRDPIFPPMTNLTFESPGVLKDANMLGTETEIIETVYDMQTNGFVANRVWVWDDGTMAATTTFGKTPPSFADRGTGYNYFNGELWGPKPSSRIEGSYRTGWPSIAPWGANGEIVVAHTTATAPYPLRINKRENKGSGDWIGSDLNGPGGDFEPSWARIATSGDNNEIIHIFYNSYNDFAGQELALAYSRSDDGGVTWNPHNEILPELSSDYYTAIRADSYMLASKNNIVVLLVASAWNDLFFLKTTDHGLTWEKIIVWQHPYPFFDFNTTLMSDTLYSVDNSASCAIGDDGMVHVVWGIGRVARLEAAPPEPGYYNYWPYTDGIGYWNESMGQIPEADNPHHTMSPDYLESIGMLVGWTQDLNNSGSIFDFEGSGEPPFNVYRSLGISSMPTVAVNGNMVAVAFSSVTETYITADGVYNYKRIWNRFSYDKGQTWGPFIHLQHDNIFHLYDESIWPEIASNTTSDGVFHLFYNADNLPGLYGDDDHEPIINRIIHNEMDFTVGVNELSKPYERDFSVSQNYPNPAVNVTNLILEVNKPSKISVEVINLTGQKVLEIPTKFFPVGNHNIRLNISTLTPGVYFYSINNGIENQTKKMIVK
ncbi:MAG TPA: T9SS type A sorting domain-containing protein [Bacteroidales bacterium]|nr:MAG: BNR/Asp-box repeat protein [Bacteroidetes bacterium ADurb.Bin041]HNV49867.1 T9SS type A sorting domain-containing protein [Bacteroidales bacterium]HPW43194.1 T9SS type A sorting domain-containing protein [Bacteroidales bacterium]